MKTCDKCKKQKDFLIPVPGRKVCKDCLDFLKKMVIIKWLHGDFGGEFFHEKRISSCEPQ